MCQILTLGDALGLELWQLLCHVDPHLSDMDLLKYMGYMNVFKSIWRHLDVYGGI